MSRLLKKIAIIETVIGGLATIFLSLYMWKDSGKLALLLTLILGIFSTAVTVVPMFVLVNITDKLAYANQVLYENNILLNNLYTAQTGIEHSEYLVSCQDGVAPLNKATGKVWVCKKCKASNDEFAQYCKSCGQYK